MSRVPPIRIWISPSAAKSRTIPQILADRLKALPSFTRSNQLRSIGSVKSPEQHKNRCNSRCNGFWQNSLITDSAPAWVGKDMVQGNPRDDCVSGPVPLSIRLSGYVHSAGCLEARDRWCIYSDHSHRDNPESPKASEWRRSQPRKRKRREHKLERQGPMIRSAETIALHLKPSAISS